MPARGALRQVQNVASTRASRKGELKTVKTSAATRTQATSAAVEALDENKPTSKKLKVKNDRKRNEKIIRELGMKEKRYNDEAKSDESADAKQAEIVSKLPKTVEAKVQTDVSVSEKMPQLTAEDLKSPEVSENYWRRLAERLSADLDRELEKNFQLSVRLARLTEEIQQKQGDNEAIEHYLEAEGSSKDSDESESVFSNESEGDGDEHDDFDPEKYIIPL